jgi:hypothetical protein
MRLLIALTALPFAVAAAQPAPQTDAWKILEAILALPIRSAELRSEGVSDRVLRETIDAIRRDRVSAVDAIEILTAERDELRQGGRPDNFGAFVQYAHSRGLRGQELAAAIHAEKARRGGNVGVGRGRGGQNDGRGRGGVDDDRDDRERRGADTNKGRGGPPNGRGRGGK